MMSRLQVVVCDGGGRWVMFLRKWWEDVKVAKSFQTLLIMRCRLLLPASITSEEVIHILAQSNKIRH